MILGKVIGGSHTNRFVAAFNGGMASKENERHVKPCSSRHLQGGDSTETRHTGVGKNQVDSALTQGGPKRLFILDACDLARETGSFQSPSNLFRVLQVIFQMKNA